LKSGTPDAHTEVCTLYAELFEDWELVSYTGHSPKYQLKDHFSVLPNAYTFKEVALTTYERRLNSMLDAFVNGFEKITHDLGPKDCYVGNHLKKLL